MPRDFPCAVLSADFLVVSEGEVEGAPRFVALGEQRLGGFEKRHHAQLVVHRPAAPDDAVRDRSGERLVRPVRQRDLVNRHNIHVSHQQDGLQCRIGPRDVEQQAVAAVHGFPGTLVHQRERLLQEVVEGQERIGIEVRAVVV